MVKQSLKDYPINYLDLLYDLYRWLLSLINIDGPMKILINFHTNKNPLLPYIILLGIINGSKNFNTYTKNLIYWLNLLFIINNIIG